MSSLFVILYFVQIDALLVGYYSNNFTTEETILINTRLDNTSGFPLNYDSFTQAPWYFQRAYYFSVIWRGNITAKVFGVYLLYTSEDDELYITIDGKLILSNADYTIAKTSFPFALDQNYHTIVMKYYQGVYGSSLHIQPNSTNCCSLGGGAGLIAEMYYYDPYPFYEHIQTDAYLSWTIADFPPFKAAKWKGTISTPSNFLGQVVSFRATRGMRVTFNDQLLFDSYYYDQPSTDCYFRATLLNNEYNVTIEFQQLLAINYWAVYLLWGLATDLSPFPADPFLTVENNTVLKKDTVLGNLALQKDAILQVIGNLFVINDSSISGQLIVNGHLSVTRITIFLPNQLNTTTPIIQTNLLSNLSATTTIIIKNSLLTTHIPYKIISFNSSTTQFHFLFPDESRDSTWDCKGDGYQYSSIVAESGVFILKSSGSSGCGIGVKVIAGVVGSVFGVVLIAGLCICQRRKDFENKLHEFSTRMKP